MNAGIVGEDSGAGACQLCVELCPEVFEKPFHSSCARVRPDAVPALHMACVAEAARHCPVEAIRITKRAVSGPDYGKRLHEMT